MNSSGIPAKSVAHNRVSFLGLIIMVVSTAIGLPVLFYDMLSSHTNPYAGILVYMALPGVAVFGAGVWILGVLLEIWNRKRHGAQSWEYPRLKLDLNLPHARRNLVGFIAGAVVLLVLANITAYQGYHYTESVRFCGLTCHGPMKPEFTAYQGSAHARVACVECHVGPGAGWYVKSKVSGAYQLYSVTFNKYSRPIETPINNLRPAQETCEQCHWPAKFFGAQQKLFSHVLADEKNSPWEIQSLIKIGGGNVVGGIHWHMNIASDIYYVASDSKQETIPWVKAVSKDSHAVTEYMSTESPLTPEQLAQAKPHRMDCVDCHNRPSHVFLPPDRSMDFAFETGRFDSSLPYLKREGMRLLAADYKTEEEALKAIRAGLPAFYEKNYAVVAKQKSASIVQATSVLENIFSSTIFPEMKTNWLVHPNHIGHLNSDGCFRCHDGLHKSAGGKVISNECSTCHTFLAQGSPKEVSKARLQAQPFKHPVDLGGVDLSTVKCSQCHSGTIGL